MKNINPKYEIAYYVSSWSDKIVKGKAFTLTYIDYYEKKSSFFIPDGETVPKLVEARCVVYSQSDAVDLLNSEQKSKKKYYQEQLTEAEQKLKEFAI